MPHQSGPLLTNEALDQLARRWLAGVQAEQPKVSASQSRGDVASYGTLLDWLLDADDDAVAGDLSVD
ncbi:hypothetical protein FV219_00620 [Methylobacterium sp. WL122]|nr:hypothetical protein FV219_00620 [Methylobacterium sp. WL122]